MFPSVREHLDYRSFRGFCAYNFHTEGTAELCWRRLSEIGPRVPVAGEQVEDFRRIAADEDRHRRIFGVLAAAVSDEDGLRDGVAEESLSRRLSAILAQRGVRDPGPDARPPHPTGSSDPAPPDSTLSGYWVP